jgi:hypothetical protein
MSYIFMVIDHPRPEHRDDLIRGMVERAELTATTPGFIEAGPWEIENDQRIVGISRWEKEAFAAAAPPGFGVPTDDVHEWETRPPRTLPPRKPKLRPHGGGRGKP